MANDSINIDPLLVPTRQSLATRAMTKGPDQIFRAKFHEDSRQAISKVLSRIRSDEEESQQFRASFVVGARGAGKSQALLEMGIQILDDWEENGEVHEAVTLPIIVYCAGINWSQDIGSILSDLEEQIVESLVKFLDVVIERGKDNQHKWGENRERLKRLSKDLGGTKFPTSKLLGLKVSEIANKFLSMNVRIVAMMEDYDKLTDSDAVDFISGAQNELSEWPLHMVFTLQPVTWKLASNSPGCNWVITTGTRYSGPEKIRLPDLSGNAEYLREALNERMKHVERRPGNKWLFKHDTPPSEDQLESLGEHFVSIDKLFQDHGLFEIIQVAQSSDPDEKGSMRNILRATQQVLNKLPADSPDASPLEVKECLQEDSAEILESPITVLLADITDEQTHMLGNLYNWAVHSNENRAILVEGLHGFRNHGYKILQKRKNTKKSGLKNRDFAPGDSTIEGIKDEILKAEALQFFQMLGLVFSGQGGRKLVFLRDFFCDIGRQIDWIDDSTKAITIHLMNALDRPLSERKQLADLESSIQEAKQRKGTYEWTSFNSRLRTIMEPVGHTMGGWGHIPPTDRIEILGRWMKKFVEWLSDIADKTDRKPKTYGLQMKIDEIFRVEPVRTSSGTMVRRSKDMTEEGTAKAIEHATDCYKHFFRTRGLDAEALRTFAQVVGTNTEGTTPLDLREHLPEIVEVSCVTPIPVPLRAWGYTGVGDDEILGLSIYHARQEVELDKLLIAGTLSADGEMLHGTVPLLAVSPSSTPEIHDQLYIIHHSNEWLKNQPEDIVEEIYERILVFIGEVLDSVNDPPALKKWSNNYDMLGEFKNAAIFTMFRSRQLNSEIFRQFIQAQDIFTMMNSEGVDSGSVSTKIKNSHWKPVQLPQEDG